MSSVVSFRRRRCFAVLATLIACVVFWVLHQFTDNRLAYASFFSGGTLFACILILTAFGLRKRFSMLPLLSVATWTQIHIYTGLFTLVVYLAHVPAILANGIFESGLSLLFLAVSASGLYGLYLSRTAPKKLTAVPGEFRFDQISWHRQKIYDRATDVLRSLDASLAAPVLATYFRDRLQPYFAGGVPFDFIVVPNSLRRRKLLLGLGDLERYLSPETLPASGELAALVRKRDELDLHFALQWKLRVWLIFHIVLASLLLINSVVHIALVTSFI